MNKIFVDNESNLINRKMTYFLAFLLSMGFIGCKIVGTRDTEREMHFTLRMFGRECATLTRENGLDNFTLKDVMMQDF